MNFFVLVIEGLDEQIQYLLVLQYRINRLVPVIVSHFENSSESDWTSFLEIGVQMGSVKNFPVLNVVDQHPKLFLIFLND